MIIPIKCFTCGKVIADKYEYYKMMVRNKKLAKSQPLDKIIYLTKDNAEKTPEGEVLDELKMTGECCRRHFLTHVDVN